MPAATKGAVITARGVNETEEERHGEKRAASEKAIPIVVPPPLSSENKQINNYRDQVGSVPYTGSSSYHGSHNNSSSAYDYYSDDGSFRSGGGGFPSSFRNSNYPSSLGLLTTTTAEECTTNSSNYIGLPSTDDTASPAITSYDPVPALSRMNFETGSYDTCAEYLTHSAMTRHAENFYQQHRTKNPAKPSIAASPALNNTPHSYYGNNYTPPQQPSLNHTHAHYKDRHKQQQHYHGNNEVHNMSMELTFENSNLPSYGLAGTVPFTSSSTAEYEQSCGGTADHMDEFEPFEFLQHCDSSMSPRQPAASNSNTEQSAPRFSIPLL